MQFRWLAVALYAGFSGGILGAAGAVATPAGDAQQGQQAFAVCGACHQVGPTAKNAVGPVLNGIVGRKAGSYPGYVYSAANKNSGITWTVATLQQYLANPQRVIPGNKMPFPGLHDAAKVDNIIAFLAQFNETGEKAP